VYRDDTGAFVSVLAGYPLINRPFSSLSIKMASLLLFGKKTHVKERLTYDIWSTRMLMHLLFREGKNICHPKYLKSLYKKC
jgi:hypothetical protein